jgi:serine/threonine protein kinase
MSREVTDSEVLTCSQCGAPLTADAVADERMFCPRCASALGPHPHPAPAKKVLTLEGQRLDDFEIFELIGGEPLSEIYRARQMSLGRPVVLKILREEFLEDAVAVARFCEEAQAATAFGHPNAVKVVRWGCTDLRHFIALEHVEGETLASRLERDGSPPAEQALAWMRDIAAVLAAAHAAGVIHCDVRPASLLITPEGGMKLGGFGLARRKQSADGRTLVELVEAPLYYPPEAASGGRLDERSDLYLLGATFYHALAGRPPFQAGSPVETALDYIRGEVPPLNQLAPNAPAALCRLLEKLLRRRPDERYQSAAEVIEAVGRIEGFFSRLRAARRAQPVAAPKPPERREPGPQAAEPPKPSTPAERARTKERERKRLTRTVLVVGSAALLFAALLAGLALIPGSTPSPTPLAAAPVKATEPDQRVPRPRSQAPVPPPVPAPEPVVLRAADAAIRGEARYEQGGGKDNIGSWFGDDASARWECRLQSSGTFEVEIVFAGEPAIEGNEYAVIVADQILTGRVRSTGSWTAFVTEKVGTITVPTPGTYALSVKPFKKTGPGRPLMNLQAVNLRPVRK